MELKNTQNAGEMPLPPKSWLFENIMAILLCCCLGHGVSVILGAVGLWFSGKVGSRFAEGNEAGAVQASSNARTFFLANVILSVLIGGGMIAAYSYVGGNYLGFLGPVYELLIEVLKGNF